MCQEGSTTEGENKKNLRKIQKSKVEKINPRENKEGIFNYEGLGEAVSQKSLVFSNKNGSFN